MATSFDALMRKFLLIPVASIGRVLTVVLLTVMVVLGLVIYKVNGYIALGSLRYFEEIASSITHTVKLSVDATCFALEAVGSGHSRQQHEVDVYRIIRSLHLKTLIFVDSRGRGEGHNGLYYDFSRNPEIMAAVRGKSMVLDCAAIHAQDGTRQLENHLALAVPVIRQGRLAGAVVADVGESWGNNIMNAVILGGNMSFAIFDRTGHRLIRSADFLPADRPASEEIRNLVDTLSKEQIGAQITRLINNPSLDSVSFSYEGRSGHNEAIVLTLRDYDLYLFVISSGAFGIQEFASMDRMVSGSYITLLTMLTLVCIILCIFYRYCRNLAFVDPVTKGMSSVRFELEFADRLRRAYPGKYVFFRVNINKFKLFNDFFGRVEGDRLLGVFHANMQAELPRVGVCLCRSGIDDFDLLTCGMKIEYVIACLERAVEETTRSLVSTRGNRIDYSFSIRVGAHPILDTSADYVMIKDCAGIAMERADRAYGTCLYYAVFDEEDMRNARRERKIENSMQQSLDDESFFVMLQPKVVMLTGAICGAEALVRWHHPALGRISPGEFIPIFERNGFIHKLDMWVFTRVCSLMRGWMQKGYALVPVSVNLSRADIESITDLATELSKIADEYGIPHEYLELEVTETLFNRQPEVIQRAIDSIRSAGFQCSLDDFGSGYSSLNLLPELRVDTLKIDRSFFTSEELNRGRNRVVIKMMVELARELGIKVVAEGVETVGQRNFLCQCSCIVGQGFLYSKPLLPDEFEDITFRKKLSLC